MCDLAQSKLGCEYKMKKRWSHSVTEMSCLVICQYQTPPGSAVLYGAFNTLKFGALNQDETLLWTLTQTAANQRCAVVLNSATF